ncbi:glycosyltransferase involved in cell wall biosynthesis [Anaerobacterium chartisolvens]|uniref:Glycosyltransferase involved in cell wall biosynthesis n=1 Tax=Anaerobacterium chartisolvens TaxID=1297424 RepID=A0A369AL30_9FIRM|nr:glycosyltransferase family 2 protein [Anaerobacterium chartisolvens]RCX09881.1 glycosyltransferase involved in cell wall biosynthesis [Anaerobacterium chartisolvens]
MQIKISVIMLTYNRESLVASAIKSILSQTFRDFEFIIVDNGSTDKSGVIAEEFAKQDSRIKVVHIQKSNIGTGRNTGLDVAEGEYITFIDDDDIAEPDMLEFLYRLAEDNSADISICGSSKEVGGKILPNYVFDDYMVMTASQAVVEMLKRKKYNVAMPTKLLRKSMFNKIRFFSIGNYDDITVGYRFLANASKVVAYGLPKYCFCRHLGNNSSFTTNDNLLNPVQLDEYFEAFRERTEYLSEVLPDIGDYARYSEWSYMISMCNKISKNNLISCQRQLEFVRKELEGHYEEFYNCPYIEEFEREFMRKYIRKPQYV